MIQHPPYHKMDNTISLSHHNISHHRYMVLSPSNYSASFEDHKLLLVSLQRPKSTESETLHLFTEVGLKLILVLCSACVIAGFVAFCMRWLPRKAARYRRLSSIPGLRERYKPRAQCLLNEETDQQGSDADTERCTVPILNEVTRIWQHIYAPFYTVTVAKEIFLLIYMTSSINGQWDYCRLMGINDFSLSSCRYRVLAMYEVTSINTQPIKSSPKSMGVHLLVLLEQVRLLGIIQ